MGIELASPCILWYRARTVSFELPPKQTEHAKKQRSLTEESKFCEYHQILKLQERKYYSIMSKERIVDQLAF
jgi:hypothetical protein